MKEYRQLIGWSVTNRFKYKIDLAFTSQRLGLLYSEPEMLNIKILYGALSFAILRGITAWKVSKYGVISDPNTRKYGPDITPYLNTFDAV